MRYTHEFNFEVGGVTYIASLGLIVDVDRHPANYNVKTYGAKVLSAVMFHCDGRMTNYSMQQSLRPFALAEFNNRERDKFLQGVMDESY